MGTDGDGGLETEAVGVAQEFFDADLGDSSLEQITDGGLVLVEDVHELGLCVALPANVFEDSGQYFRLDLERGGFGRGEAECVEDISLDDAGGLIDGRVRFGRHLYKIYYKRRG